MLTIGRMLQYGGGAVLAGLAMTALAPAPAAAGTVSFAYGSLADNATDATIQSFMNTALSGIGSVAVTGAIASNSYNADGHVTGPSSHDGANSYTLANLDPAGHGTFIENDTANSHNDILMSFTGITISSISFDLEIFPDDSCTGLSSNGRDCGGQRQPEPARFELAGQWLADRAMVGPDPRQRPSSNGIPASAYTHSPASGSYDTEQAPQLLGASGLLTLPADTTTVDFQDWPATIAVNNLVVNYTPNDPPPAVPEPGSSGPPRLGPPRLRPVPASAPRKLSKADSSGTMGAPR